MISTFWSRLLGKCLSSKGFIVALHRNLNRPNGSWVIIVHNRNLHVSTKRLSFPCKMLIYLELLRVNHIIFLIMLISLTKNCCICEDPKENRKPMCVKSQLSVADRYDMSGVIHDLAIRRFTRALVDSLSIWQLQVFPSIRRHDMLSLNKDMKNTI